MKINHDGKRYNTDNCKVIAKQHLYSHSNNYAGTKYLIAASDGQLLAWTDTNGQDCWITDDLSAVDCNLAKSMLDKMDLDPDQEVLAVDLGLITLIN